MTKLRSHMRFFNRASLLLLLSLSAHAASPDQTSSSKANNSSAQQSINAYLNRLDQLEGQFGAYEPELSQELAGLGALYQSVDRHREAVDAFKRQYQIERTNDGLYSINQVDILKRMIVSLVALREWEEVEDRHYFIQQLMAYNFAENDPRKIASLKDRAEWHMYAATNQIDKKPSLHHLLTARSALNEASRLASATGGPVTIETEELYQTLLYIDYQVAISERQAANQAQSRALLDRRTQTDSFYYRRNTDEFGPSATSPLGRGPTLGLNSFRSGLRHLESLRNSYANDPTAKPGSVQRIDAQIGDWCALWQRHATAKSFYQRTWEALSTAGADPQIRNEIFDQPVRILDFADQYLARTTPAPGSKKGYVLYNLNIGANGKVTGNTLLEASPNHLASDIARTTKIVNKTQFRPRYVDGQPVSTENFKTKVFFDYEASDAPNAGS